MSFLLTNEQRVYLGLPLIEESWDCVHLSDEYDAYFDGDTIRKTIITRVNYYYESSLEETTLNNRTTLAPKTNRGKETKLTIANLEKKTGIGTYFFYDETYFVIGNYSTQTTYYDSTMASVQCTNFNELESWINTWIAQTTETDLREIEDFSNSKKRHAKYAEGDFFRFKIDRGLYGYGRILLDYNRLRKENIEFWDILMGKPLVVKVYHIVSSDPHMLPTDIKIHNSIPSQFIFDNRFYYGEYEIIGNEPVNQDEEDYPIMYGRSINAIKPIKLIFQQGLIYKQMDNVKEKFYGNFRNNGIGWGLDVNRKILEECISNNSNQPYWEQARPYQKDDLRNPKYDKIREQIFRDFNIIKTDIKPSSKKWTLKNLFKK
jgi:hypothetical protein